MCVHWRNRCFRVVRSMKCSNCLNPATPGMRSCEECRAKARERERRYRETHPERHRKNARKATRRWQEANREKSREATRRWYDNNRESVLAKARRRREENLEEARERDRRKHAKLKYGISLEAAEALRASPCDICGKHGGNIDHDHDTGIVRGSLCRACNHGLGNFRDSPGLLARALEYLRDGWRSNLGSSTIR